MHANQSVCLYDRTVLAYDWDKIVFELPDTVPQVLVHDDCRIHIKLGQSMGRTKNIERCISSGETVVRQIRLTDPLYRWEQDFPDPAKTDLAIKNPFAYRPRPEMVVDVEYILDSERELVTTRPASFTNGEQVRTLEHVDKSMWELHWASSAPISIPDLEMISKDEPCVPGPEWIP